ncbi:MAG: wax ester/triacylglycerol synthase family O-acyltransferase [Pseudomonadales bacterium]|nr:wax ester/triacylglycerol synthase family O-acyltransferase [Pseudomonadales bacterium]
MKRVAMMEDTFLRLENRRQPLNMGMLMLLDPPKDAGKDFAKNIAERLRECTDFAPPFNQRLVRRAGLDYWVEDKDLDLDQHFVHLSLPAPGRIRELLAMVSRVHSNHLDRAFPLWRLYLIEGIEDGRIAMYLKIHHSLTDGISGIQMLKSSMSTDQEASKTMPAPWAIGIKKPKNAQPLPVPTPADSISALRTMAQQGFSSGLNSIKAVGREIYKSFKDYREHNPDFALGGQAPRSIFNHKVSSSRRFAAQSYSTPRIRAVARANDATSNDVILAMCSGALRYYLEDRHELPKEPLLAAIPVSVRREDHPTDAANEVAFTMTHLATNIDDPIERLKAIKSCMDYNKERIHNLSPGELTTYAAMMLLPGVTNSILGYAPNKALGSAVISHVPGPREDVYWQGAKLSGLYPVSLVVDSVALNITIISRHDFVDFGIIACRKTVPSMQKMLKYLQVALEDMEKAIGIEIPDSEEEKATQAKPDDAEKAIEKVTGEARSVAVS